LLIIVDDLTRKYSLHNILMNSAVHFALN